MKRTSSFRRAAMLLGIGLVSGCSLDIDALRQGSGDAGMTMMPDAPSCTPDPQCADAGGSRCDGDNLIECTADAQGCMTATVTTCTDSGTVCNEDAGAASCVDPCSLITTCDAATSCDGRSLVTCSADDNGCLVDPMPMQCDWYCGMSDTDASCIDAQCPLFSHSAMEIDCSAGTYMFAPGDLRYTQVPFCDGQLTNQIGVVPFRASERSVVTIDAVTSASPTAMQAIDLHDGRAGDCLSGYDCRQGFATITTTPTRREFIAEAGVPYYLAWGSIGGVYGPPALTISCTTIVCGNSMIETSPDGFGETCDDGNTDPGDGCSPGCQRSNGWRCTGEPSVCEEVCGNGMVDMDASELCDDGNTTAGDGCSADCQTEHGYLCTSTSGSPSSCTHVCGNGMLDAAAGEECDDGNEVDGDGCSSECYFEAGYICSGEPSMCELACGNSTIDVAQGEDCDDGNTVAGDGCSDTCQRERYYTCSGEPSVCEVACGNGQLDYIPERPETCDDGNTTDGDGCSSQCGTELNYVCSGTPDVCTFSCGNGTLDYQAGETCDDGNRVDGDGCSRDCYLEPLYTCSGATCTRVCGNGTLDYGTNPPEQCDDHNLTDGDGCSSTCRMEPGYACVDGTDCNQTRCGNLIVDGEEECDDGNSDNTDGCTAQCTMQTGFYCQHVPSTCALTSCGDSTQDPGEGCDDGNRSPGDGCSPRCAVELPAVGMTTSVTGLLALTDPTYQRQNADCRVNMSTGDFYYRSYVFENTGPSRLTISVLADWTADGYLHVYDFPFVPEEPTARCVDGNDDYGNTGRSFIPPFSVDPGQRIVVVASTFSPNVTMDDYTITVRAY